MAVASIERRDPGRSMGNLLWAESANEFRGLVKEHGSLFGTESPRSQGWTPGEPVETSSYYYRGTPIVRPARRRPSAPTVVELFSGCGGLSTGFEAAGYQSVLGADIHLPSGDTYYRNHECAHFIVGDLRRVHECDLASLLDRTPEIVLAGIPCQGFSLNNRKRFHGDERNFLFLELLRMLEVLLPPLVVVENVPGLKTSNNGGFISEIRSGLAAIGYCQTEVRKLNAADYGVPQLRERLFIVASRWKHEFGWPQTSHGAGTGQGHLTVGDAISDLPPLRNGEMKSTYERDPTTALQRQLRGRQQKLLNHEAPSHPEETRCRIAATRQGEPMYPRFRQRIRLAMNRPSPTQVSGGIRPQFQFGHPMQARGLSIRERCRIQTFPDSYEILGGIVQGRVQTGNAVPPLLATALGEACAVYLSKARGKR